MKKERFDLITDNGFTVSDCEVVKNMVNKLIEALYIPDKEHEFVTDPLRLEKFGIEKEPINWGDLKCFEVIKGKNAYVSIIDEAAPEECPTFCEYITKYMELWGWTVEVITEW